MMEIPARARVIVSGRVQGVFFRVETRSKAVSLGLSGWVRNLADGSVEAVFEGDRPLVEKAIDWCRHGPPGAAVARVDATWEEPVGERGYHVRYR
jgi:acylphosphatase